MKNLKKNIRVIYLGMAVNNCHILTLEKVGFFIGFKMGNVNKKVWEIQTSNCILKIKNWQC
jgi:hypothetical protein